MAEEIFMVRYDFFPELLYFSLLIPKSILLSATLKGKKLTSLISKYRWKKIFSCFKAVFAATKKDEEALLNLFKGEERTFKVFNLDFRHGQILKRQAAKEKLLEVNGYEQFEKEITQHDWNNRFIMGSIWPNEWPIFSQKFLEYIVKENLFVFLAPHKLSGNDWSDFESKVSNLSGDEMNVSLWDKEGWLYLSETISTGQGHIVICRVPGILCELYPYFGHAFVGGGHSRSIHSVLEPYWGGSHIYCGPKTHRSTEYDFILEESPRHIHIVRELDKFYHTYNQAKEIPIDREHRERLGRKLIGQQNKAFLS